MLQPGDLVLTAAFGAGMSWGASLMRWTMTAPAEPEPEPVGSALQAEGPADV